MLTTFLSGALIGLIVSAVSYYTMPVRKKMTKTKLIFLFAIICIIIGLFNIVLPE